MPPICRDKGFTALVNDRHCIFKVDCFNHDEVPKFKRFCLKVLLKTVQCSKNLACRVASINLHYLHDILYEAYSYITSPMRDN